MISLIEWELTFKLDHTIRQLIHRIFSYMKLVQGSKVSGSQIMKSLRSLEDVLAGNLTLDMVRKLINLLQRLSDKISVEKVYNHHPHHGYYC